MRPAPQRLLLAVTVMGQPAVVVRLEHIFATQGGGVEAAIVAQICICLHVQSDRAHRRLHVAISVQLIFLLHVRAQLARRVARRPLLRQRLLLLRHEA